MLPCCPVGAPYGAPVGQRTLTISQLQAPPFSRPPFVRAPKQRCSKRTLSFCLRRMHWPNVWRNVSDPTPYLTATAHAAPSLPHSTPGNGVPYSTHSPQICAIAHLLWLHCHSTDGRVCVTSCLCGLHIMPDRTPCLFFPYTFCYPALCWRGILLFRLARLITLGLCVMHSSSRV